MQLAGRASCIRRNPGLKCIKGMQAMPRSGRRPGPVCTHVCHRRQPSAALGMLCVTMQPRQCRQPTHSLQVLVLRLHTSPWRSHGAIVILLRSAERYLKAHCKASRRGYALECITRSCRQHLRAHSPCMHSLPGRQDPGSTLTVMQPMCHLKRRHPYTNQALCKASWRASAHHSTSPPHPLKPTSYRGCATVKMCSTFSCSGQHERQSRSSQSSEMPPSPSPPPPHTAPAALGHHHHHQQQQQAGS